MEAPDKHRAGLGMMEKGKLKSPQSSLGYTYTGEDSNIPDVYKRDKEYVPCRSLLQGEGWKDSKVGG